MKKYKYDLDSDGKPTPFYGPKQTIIVGFVPVEDNGEILFLRADMNIDNASKGSNCKSKSSTLENFDQNLIFLLIAYFMITCTLENHLKSRYLYLIIKAIRFLWSVRPTVRFRPLLITFLLNLRP